MSETISVIVPVYNVQEYLPKCLDSVIGQTYENLEILLVNDGSTDESAEICDRYARMDGRIHVIHQENQGLAAARNAGLEAAAGMYIGFVDSDDWIDLDMYEFLYRLMHEYRADLAMCRLTEITNTESVDRSTGKLLVCDGLTAVKRIFKRESDYHIGYSVFNKLYKKSWWQNSGFQLAGSLKIFTLRRRLWFAAGNASTGIRLNTIT
ncbi:glycosyltransferase family 2 protein [Planococcus koreensis]|uniref:glycosyltransferase family 2 protein n=1 Tax=Planococcus koreensis TaxID=112331 RepID=UPI0039FDC434